MSQIIDLSSNNGNIDWKIIGQNSQNLQGVYLKVSEGVGYLDGKVKYNALNADMLKLPVGYYHFASLNNIADVAGDAKAEVKYFLTQCKLLPKPKLPYALDVETNKSHLSKDQVLLWIKTFFSELEANGVKDYVLYSYAPFLNENLPANHGLGEKKLWIAAYTSNLTLPHGWDKAWMWQYSNQGNIPGISTRVDLNKKL